MRGTQEFKTKPYKCFDIRRDRTEHKIYFCLPKILPWYKRVWIQWYDTKTRNFAGWHLKNRLKINVYPCRSLSKEKNFFQTFLAERKNSKCSRPEDSYNNLPHLIAYEGLLKHLNFTFRYKSLAIKFLKEKRTISTIFICFTNFILWEIFKWKFSFFKCCFRVLI